MLITIATLIFLFVLIDVHQCMHGSLQAMTLNLIMPDNVDFNQQQQVSKPPTITIKLATNVCSKPIIHCFYTWNVMH